MSHPPNAMDEEVGRMKKIASLLDLLGHDAGVATSLTFDKLRFSVKIKGGVKEILHGVKGEHALASRAAMVVARGGERERRSNESRCIARWRRRR